MTEAKGRKGKKTTYYMEESNQDASLTRIWDSQLTGGDHLGLAPNTRERTEPHPQPDPLL